MKRHQLTVGGPKRPIFNAISCLIFRTFKNWHKSLRQNYLSWTLVYAGVFFMQIYLFLERTRQTTVGAVFVDSHAFVAMHFC